MALLTKGIKFEVAQYTGGSLGTYSEILGLQEIPSLASSPEKVDITTLADGEYKYMQGIKSYDDLDFKFLFDGSASGNFATLKGLEVDSNDNPKTVSVRITLNDAITEGSSGHGTQFTFDAQLVSGIDGGGVNAAITFTCNAALQSEISYVAAV